MFFAVWCFGCDVMPRIEQRAVHLKCLRICIHCAILQQQQCSTGSTQAQLCGAVLLEYNGLQGGSSSNHFPWFKRFWNDRDRADMVACGAAAGKVPSEAAALRGL
jgi:hypothetical protein